MILFDLFRRDKLSRFTQTLREEGLGRALAKTRRYLWARLGGHGLTGLFRSGGAQSGVPGEYLTPVWLELAERGGFHITHAPATLSKRRKVAMIADMGLPQCRKYRVEQLAELWSLADVEYSFCDYREVDEAVANLQDATHAMFYRLCTTPVSSMLAYEARRLRLPILYDLDDPLFSVSAYGTYQNMNALPAWQKRHFLNEAPKFLDVMNGADMVSVSTPGLVEHARAFTSRPVHMRRNFADHVTLEAGQAALRAVREQRPETSHFRVGFASGSQGHEIDFALIAKDLTEFLAGGMDRQLVILGHFDKKLLPEELRGQVETHKFAGYETYLETLASLDVAVMPLTDDQFNRCKSGVRVIDAASVGVPGIVGTTSDMSHMVEDGRTGRVLGAGASWRAAMEDMAADRAATRAMGAAARKDLEDHWGASLRDNIIDPEILTWVKA